MWSHGVAIRPVPPYAVVEPRTVDAIREAFEDDEDEAQKRLDDAFTRFESSQPALSRRLEEALERRGLDDTARTLGYFLGVCVWLAFDKQFDARLGRVDETAARAAAASLELESELRAAHDGLLPASGGPGGPIEAEDVVAREQPALMELIHDHVDVAIETRTGEVDTDDVYAIYRVLLAQVLGLSYAVAPSPGAASRAGEVLA